MFSSLRPRVRFRALVSAACCAVLGAGLLAGAGTATAAGPAERAAAPKAAGSKVVGYFTEWGTYDRKYLVKNVETSGSAAKLTHINYAFGNVTGGKCAMGDNYAATERTHTAAESVDGVADTWDQPLRGLQPAARAEEEAPEPQGPVVLRRLDLVGGLHRGGQEPGGLRAVLLRPGRELEVGRRLRRDRHRLGVPERVRCHL